jgi:hypothetical protein
MLFQNGHGGGQRKTQEIKEWTEYKNHLLIILLSLIMVIEAIQNMSVDCYV